MSDPTRTEALEKVAEAARAVLRTVQHIAHCPALYGMNRDCACSAGDLRDALAALPEPGEAAEPGVRRRTAALVVERDTLRAEAERLRRSEEWWVREGSAVCCVYVEAGGPKIDPVPDPEDCAQWLAAEVKRLRERRGRCSRHVGEPGPSIGFDCCEVERLREAGAALQQEVERLRAAQAPSEESEA